MSKFVLRTRKSSFSSTENIYQSGSPHFLVNSSFGISLAHIMGRSTA